MSRLPVFVETLDKLKLLHEAKNADYATAANPFFNFEFAANILQQAQSSGVPARYAPYILHIATKLSRIINLLGSDGDAANESILDSMDDLAAYVILLKCDYLREIPDSANL